MNRIKRDNSPRSGAKLTASLLTALIVGSLLVLVSCSSVVTATTTTNAVALMPFDTDLRLLSAHPVIRRAASYRLSFDLHDPASLPAALSSSGETPATVREVLTEYVDDVTIVAWLVSFGAMGAWTGYNPRNTESVGIPVSDIPSLFASSSPDMGVYRLRDRKHLMLARSVDVDGQTVGAVGFILSQTFLDPALEAQAIQLQ